MHTLSGVARLTLDTNHLTRLRAHHHYDTDDALARAMELHPSQISRVLRGTTDPGVRFVAGLLHAFGPAHLGHLLHATPDQGARP